MPTRRRWLHASALLLAAPASARALTPTPVDSGATGPPAAFPGSAVSYPVVDPTTVLRFPRDHGAHPDFRIEWWYLTGWLEDVDDRRPWGFQLTFFRIRTAYPDGNPSRFSPQHLVAAHAAIVDAAAGRHPQVHRLLNQGSTGVHLGRDDTDCAIPGWRLVRDADDHYRTTLDEAAFGWTLDLWGARGQVIAANLLLGMVVVAELVRAALTLALMPRR